MQEWLFEILTEHGAVNRRNLQQTRSKDDATVAVMIESFPEDLRGNKQEMIADAVEALMEDDRIYEYREGKSVMLTAKRPGLKLAKDGGDGTDNE